MVPLPTFATAQSLCNRAQSGAKATVSMTRHGAMGIAQASDLPSHPTSKILGEHPAELNVVKIMRCRDDGDLQGSERNVGLSLLLTQRAFGMETEFSMLSFFENIRWRVMYVQGSNSFFFSRCFFKFLYCC